MVESIISSASSSKPVGKTVGGILYINLIIIGEMSVGKTSIVNQYVYKKFNTDEMASQGVDFSKKSFSSDSTGEKC